VKARHQLRRVNIHLLPCSLRSVSGFVRQIAGGCLITLRPRHLILDPEDMSEAVFWNAAIIREVMRHTP
jgi:hypothetical protein